MENDYYKMDVEHELREIKDKITLAICELNYHGEEHTIAWLDKAASQLGSLEHNILRKIKLQSKLCI